MRKVFIMLLLTLCCVSFTGCGPLRTPAEMAELNDGPYPKNYQEIVINYMSRRLADPYSARYEFQGEPQVLYKRTGVFSFYSHDYWGWGGVVHINAKNRFGAYTGAEPYQYIIRNDEIVWMF